MNEIGQHDQSNAAKLFSLKFIKKAKEALVFSVIFPQASKNIYGADRELAATLIHSTSIIRSSEGLDEL